MPTTTLPASAPAPAKVPGALVFSGVGSKPATYPRGPAPDVALVVPGVGSCCAGMEAGMAHRVLVGLDYNGKRVEPGEVVDDIPEKSVPWLMEQGLIAESEPVSPKKGTK